MGKSVLIYFEEGQVSRHALRTIFEGDWTGREVLAAERALERGYRRYQKERRRRQNAQVSEPEPGEATGSASLDQTQATGNETAEKARGGSWSSSVLAEEIQKLSATGSDSTFSGSPEATMEEKPARTRAEVLARSRGKGKRRG